MKSNYPPEVQEQLDIFISRDGFNTIAESEYSNIMDYFSGFPVYEHLVPILTDNQSNYWCLYIGGILENKVCHLDHEEASLQPLFRNVASLLAVIEDNPDYFDFYDIPLSSFDYPPLKSDAEDLLMIEQLRKKLETETDDDIRQQLAFSVMALTSLEDIESIYPFLRDDDMYIQERAIHLLGQWKYKPAKALLLDLKESAKHNGQLAAQIALKKLNHE